MANFLLRSLDVRRVNYTADESSDTSMHKDQPSPIY